MIDIGTVKALTGGLGSLGLAVGWMYHDFTPQDSFDRYVAQNRVGVIYELLDRASAALDPEYKAVVCRSLEEEFGNLCLDAPEHPLCEDRVSLLEKVGCR